MAFGNPTYTQLPKEESMAYHVCLCSFAISKIDDELYPPSFCWIPQLLKCPYKHLVCLMLREASFSKLLACIQSAVHPGLSVTVTLTAQWLV